MSEIDKASFDYFHGSDADQFTFYRIPKMLFTDKRFSKVSVEAKVLYGLLLDRMSLSVKNGWIDEDNRVYIYFKLEDAMEFMGIGKDKGVKLFAELDDVKGCGLIQRKRQGLGKPTIIYVMNFNSGNEQSVEKEERETEEVCEVQTSEIPNSGVLDSAEVLTSEKPKSESSEIPNCRLLKNRSLDFCKSDSNNTDISYNNINYTEMSDINPIQSYLCSKPEQKSGDMDSIDEWNTYKKNIEENIDYGLLIKNYDEDMVEGIVNIMLELVCSRKKHISVNGDKVAQPIVKNRLLRLTYMHIEYVFECLMKNTTKIQNIRAYLITSLYNSLTTVTCYYTAEVNHDIYGG